MLLIGDIHITSKYKDQICESLNNLVFTNPNEHHIVLVGDFVYHFSYDRAAIMQLYQMIVSWYAMGKTVYVLAGNHDWLGSHFVFAEAKAAFDLLNQHTDNKLYFITTPELYEIEGQVVYFLPYMLDMPEVTMGLEYSGEVGSIVAHTDLLSSSEYSGERSSAHLNKLLGEQLCRHDGELLVIHHYYIADTVFPGMKSRFSYKDIALSPEWLDVDRVRMISGHLHQPFITKNYLCVGSRRHTSSLESQHYKLALRIDMTTMMLFAQTLHINPYVILTDESMIGHQRVLTVCEEILGAMELLMADNDHRKLTRTDRSLPEMSQLTVTVQTSSGSSYQDMDMMIDSSLREQLRDVKLKKTADIQLEQLNLVNPGMSLVGWQEVLKTYLQVKYPDTSERYETILRELKIL